jgi:hypothetical protein
VDWAFLVVGGFLLGALLYTAQYTTRYEPEVKPGYALLGVGIVLSVGVNTAVDFTHNISNWYRGSILATYAVVTAALVLITLERRHRYRDEDREE